MDTAARIKRIRVEKLGLTQRALADELGVDTITVSRWERGLAMPSDLNRVMLARLAGVHPNYLLGRDDDDQ